MPNSASPLIADQLVDCIANDRDPTVRELFALAERMWTEVRWDGQRSHGAACRRTRPIG